MNDERSSGDGSSWRTLYEELQRFHDDRSDEAHDAFNMADEDAIADANIAVHHANALIQYVAMMLD